MEDLLTLCTLNFPAYLPPSDHWRAFMAKGKKASPIRQKPRSSGLLDKDLGDKIRARRIMVNMSQGELGSLVGVTFQQIQKYEKGVNRLSAVRLEQIARALGEGVSYFQNDGIAMSKAGREMQSLLTDPLNLRACKALSAISDQEQRFKWVRLMESVSGIHAEE
jgi:transcriptional regulator with XRE-family HTH domain